MHPGNEHRLIERDAELAAVTDALTRPPAIVVIEGEPGIGKTRLVREALAAPELAGRAVVVGEAHPVREPFPFGPLLDALSGARLPRGELSPVVGALRPLLPERADELPLAPGPLEDAGAERHRTVRALIELFGAFGPAVLVLEDLHWADDGTIDVLRMLWSRPPPGLAVVITFRGSDAPPGSALRETLAALPSDLVRARLHLRSLTATGVGELAAAILEAGTVSDEFARHLRERSGGIPFVIEEDLRLLLERGLISQRSGVWVRRAVDELEVPPTVGDAVVERAARLSEEARAVLETAAVLDPVGDEHMIAELTGLDRERVAAGLSEALSTGVLQERGTQMVFRHALARQAIYDAIPGPRRRRIHLAAARWLETAGDEQVLGRLAHHFHAAGENAAWARNAEAAADLAHRLGEDATAFQYLREVLEAGAVQPERRAEVTAKLAWTSYPRPSDSEAVVALLREGLADAGLPAALRGELRLLLGFREIDGRGMASSAFAHIRAAIDDLAERPDLQADALATLALPWAPHQTLDDHLHYLEAARAAADRAGDPGARARVAANAAWLLIEVGEPGGLSAIEALPDPGLGRGHNRQLLRGLLNGAHAAVEVGHFRRARELAARGLRLQADLELDYYTSDLQAAETRALWAMAQLGQAQEQVQRLRGDDKPSVRLDGELLLGELLLAQGQLQEAHVALTAALEGLDELGALARTIRAAAGIVRIDLLHDDGAARALTQRLVERVASRRIWIWAAPLLPFAPLEVVSPVLDDYRAGIAGRDAPLAPAALAFFEGRIAEGAGDVQAATTAYARACEMYTALPDPRLAAHAVEAEGRCQIGLDREAAEQLLRSAWLAFTDLDAPWETNRVKQLMREAGLPVPHRRGRQSYGDELSPREKEIARRAAAGQTSREIAAEVFLSPRTIDYHLGNAMRKLAISSRRELAGALASVEENGSATRTNFTDV